MPYQWGNLLPSVFDQAAGVPAAVNASTQAMYNAGQTQANTDVANQQAQATAIANRSKLAIGRALQKSEIAKYAGADATEAFHAALADEPYGQEAYDFLTKSIVPQEKIEAKSAMPGAVLDENGTPNPLASLAYIKKNPIAGTELVGTHFDLQKAGQQGALETAETARLLQSLGINGTGVTSPVSPVTVQSGDSEIIPASNWSDADYINRETQGAKNKAQYSSENLQPAKPSPVNGSIDLGSSVLHGVLPSVYPANNQPPITSMAGNPQAIPDVSTGSFDPKLTQIAVSELPKNESDRAGMARGLGLDSSVSDADLAARASEWAYGQAIKSVGKYDPLNIHDIMGARASFSSAAPAAKQVVLASNREQGRELVSTDLSQTGARYSNLNQKQNQEVRAGNVDYVNLVADQLDLPVNALGSDIPSQHSTARGLKDGIAQSQNYQRLANELADEVAANGPTFIQSKKFETMIAGLHNQAGTAVKAANMQAQSGADEETGTGTDISSIIQQPGTIEKIRAYFQNNTSDVAEAIRNSGKLLFDRSIGKEISALRGSGNADDIYNSMVNKPDKKLSDGTVVTWNGRRYVPKNGGK